MKKFSPPDSIAMLYAYDDAGGYALHPTRKNDVLDQPIYRELANHAFWGEIVGGRYYQVPWFSSCDQTRLLGNDFTFVAPRGGLLFVQYQMDRCADCDEVTRAVEKTLADHPALPARWVQYDLASVRADWCHSKFEFIVRRDASEVGKEFTCRR